MSSRKVIGIDFGSTQSFVSELEIGSTNVPQIQELGGGQKEKHQTLLAYEKEDDTFLAAGNDVDEKIKNDTDQYYVVRNFKRYLNEALGDDAGECVKGKEANEYCQRFIQYLVELLQKRYAQKHLDPANFDVCMAYPATWEKDKQKKLKKMAEDAGLPRVRAISEPMAAVYAMRVEEGLVYADHPEKYMVIDFGGGTLDICVIQLETLGREPQILSIAGEGKLGGVEFDKIFELMYWRSSGLQKSAFTESEKWELKKACQEAKEACSRNFRDSNNKVYRHTFKIRREVEISFNRSDLENQIEEQGFFRQINACIDKALEKAGVECQDIDKVILTGGSSQWYFMRELVAKKFGIRGENNIYLTKEPCKDVSKGTSIYVGRPSDPPLQDGIWFKWRFEGDAKWQPLKRLLAPSCKANAGGKKRVENAFVGKLQGTRNWSTYKIEFQFFSGKSETECEKSFESKLHFFARSNWPSLDVWKGIYHALRHEEFKPTADSYNMYVCCKHLPGGDKIFSFEIQDADKKIISVGLSRNGVTDPQWFGLGKYKSIQNKTEE